MDESTTGGSVNFPKSPAGNTAGSGSASGTGTGSGTGSGPGASGSGTGDYRDATVTRVAMQAHDAVDRVAGSVGPIVDRVRDRATRATEMLRSGGEGRFEELQDELLTTLRTSVRQRPVAAIAIAVLAGWMLGRSGSR